MARLRWRAEVWRDQSLELSLQHEIGHGDCAHGLMRQSVDVGERELLLHAGRDLGQRGRCRAVEGEIEPDELRDELAREQRRLYRR